MVLVIHVLYIGHGSDSCIILAPYVVGACGVGACVGPYQFGRE